MKVTEFLAIYAACLSTGVFIWNIVKSTPRVRVQLMHGMDNIDGEYVHGVFICIANPSAHTVHLNSLSILYPYQKISPWYPLKFILENKRIPWHRGWVHSSLSNYDVEDGLPLSLEPGKSHKVLVPEAIIKKILDDSVRPELMASIQDQLANNKYSSKFIYNFQTNER